jgi:hypothetical protein
MRRAICRVPTPAARFGRMIFTWRIATLSAGIHRSFESPKKARLNRASRELDAPSRRGPDLSRTGGRDHSVPVGGIISFQWRYHSVLVGAFARNA